MAQNTANQQLYDLLVTKNFEIQALDGQTGRGPVDEDGNPDISKADEFRFDFVPESGKNYGSVVIFLGDNKELSIFFGDNIGKSMETEDKTEWFELLQQLKRFATKNFMSFTPQNITKLKYTKQGQAAIKEGLFESWQGKGNISWNGQPTEARLVIKHKKSLNEDEARFRYIESIYVETAEGERFKLKSRSLTAGKAMLEHVRQGGNPYDVRAQHINEIVEELSVLSRFRRANAGKVLEGDTKNLVEQTESYYKNMHSVLKHLGSQRGYSAYFESWTPSVNEGNLVVEDLKGLFVEQTIDHRIEEALPLLARITQEANAMKEAQIFESWVNNLVEGTWAIPETPEQKQTLVDLMSKELPVGADATNATEQLYDVFGDDMLFDQLQELADANANADARSVILTRMEELASESPDVEAVLGQLQTTNPGSPELDAQPDAEELGQEVAGDETLPQEVEESQLNEYLVKAGMPVKDVLALNLFQDFDPVEGAAAQFPEFAEEPMWQQVVRKYAPIANMLKKKLLAQKRRLTDAEAEAVDETWYDGSDAYDDVEIEYLVGIYNQQIDTLEALLAGNLTDEEFSEAQCNMTEAGEYCPQHKLEECGIMEYSGNWTNFGLEESDSLSQLKKLAHGK
jgi:hypothetical protein